ncbi:MAG: SRPBCC domain-containing protein [Lentisphaeraceae bacterium]|nr:SRPBCC domain-containing protein [Lentisphaeraceae bacterium]
MKRLLIILLIVFCTGVNVAAEEIKFEQTIFIKSSASKVWDALTQARIVEKYFLCPLKTIGTKKGDKLIYGNKEFDLIKGKIMVFEKDKEFTHSFQFLPPGHDNTESDEETIVSYTLQQDENLTVLTLTHKGFKEKNQTYHNVTGGWPYILSNLKTYLETGKTLNE